MKSAYKVLLVGLVVSFPISVYWVAKTIGQGTQNTELHAKVVEQLLEQKASDLKRLETDAIRVQGEMLKIEESKQRSLQELRELQSKIDRVIVGANEKPSKTQPLPAQPSNSTPTVSAEPKADTTTLQLTEQPLEIRLGKMDAIKIERTVLESGVSIPPMSLETIAKFALQNTQAKTVYISGLKKSSKNYTALRDILAESGKDLMRYNGDDIDTSESVFIFRDRN